MADVLYVHEDKERGDVIRSQDWNQLGSEVSRLEAAKLDREGDTVSGDLVISGKLGIGGKAGTAPLEITGTGTEALRITNPGAGKSLQAGVDRTGAWIQPGEGGSSLRLNATPGKATLVVNGDGKVGIGTSAPQAPLEVAGGGLLGSIAFGCSPYGELNNAFESIQLKGGHNLRFNFGTDQRMMLTNSGNLSVTGAIEGSYLTLNPQNNIHEGGELRLKGAGSWKNIQIDNYQGNLRIHTLDGGKLFQVVGGGALVAGSVRADGGFNVDGKTVIDADAGWHRTYGNTGWYNDTHGGGWHMSDSTWIRSYGNKNIYHNTGILRTDGTLQVGPNGDRFLVDASGNVGVGTTSIHNPKGWNRTLDLLGPNHARLSARTSTNGVVTCLYANSNWSGARGVIGTESNHPLTFVTNYKHQMTLDTNGSLSVTGSVRADGGFNVDGKTVIDADAGWHRTYGNTGWYNGTHGGGWHMSDSTWIRAYNKKPVYVEAGILSNAIAIGYPHHGSLKWPYETIQLNSGHNLRIYFGTTERYVLRNTGVITANGAALFSDVRRKREVVPLKDPLEILADIKGVSFKWKKDFVDDENREHLGFIAQDVEAVLPELVHTGEDGYKTLDYNGFIPLLLESVKALKQERDQLSAKITGLAARLDQLTAGA